MRYDDAELCLPEKDMHHVAHHLEARVPNHLHSSVKRRPHVLEFLQHVSHGGALTIHLQL